MYEKSKELISNATHNKELARVKKTNHNIRQSDESMNDKPLEAIAKKSHKSSHKHNHPQGEVHE